MEHCFKIIFVYILKWYIVSRLFLYTSLNGTMLQDYEIYVYIMKWYIASRLFMYTSRNGSLFSDYFCPHHEMVL